jgi:hypothetical protein
MFKRVESLTRPQAEAIVGAGDLLVVPSEVVRAFGIPTSEDFDAEGLGAFYFLGPDEQPFTLYFRAYDLRPAQVRQLRTTFWSADDSKRARVGAPRGSDVDAFKA